MAEVTIGRVRVSISVFCRLGAGHSLGCKRRSAANGALQNKREEIWEIGLIAGSKEVNRSGVMLGSTSE